MKRTILLCLAAAAVAGCAARVPAPAPEPEVIVLTGPHDDPRYQIPEKYRSRPPLQREQWARFQQEAEQVQAQVQRDPAFGGFILRWSPEPHAVVMFTGDAEARLRRYTSDPRFKAQRVDLTFAQLERMMNETGEQLARLGLQCFSVDADEEHNSVTVGALPADLARVRAAIASGEVNPPPRLRLKEGGCPEFR